MNNIIEGDIYLRIVHGTIDSSIPCIAYYLIYLLIGIFISFKISSLIMAVIFFAIGMLFLKKEEFCERYAGFLYSKESYEDYINSRVADTGCCSESIREKDCHQCGTEHIFLSIYFLYTFLIAVPQNKSVINSESIKFILLSILLLINSIIGLYLYKKYKSDKQYIISCLLMFLLILYIAVAIYKVCRDVSFFILIISALSIIDSIAYRPKHI